MSDCDTWPTPESGCVSGCDIPGDTEPEVLADAARLAGVIMRTLSGQRAGTCTETLRPLGACGCSGRCSCGGDKIRLESANGPVVSVEQVMVDGEPVDPATYRFYPSGQLLYRVPPARWPTRDHKYADCGETGTMCVDVTSGYELDAWAVAVHAELTCELLKNCTGQPCRIPANSTTVTGQGITIGLSPAELKQFIPSVAGWVAAINPNNAVNHTRLFSPDLNNGRAGGGGASSTGGPPTIDGGGP